MSAAKRPVVPIADMKLLLPPEDIPAEFPPEPDPEPPPLAMFCWADWNAALRAETPPPALDTPAAIAEPAAAATAAPVATDSIEPAYSAGNMPTH
ncbi:MAG TPA: hypothetical protein ACQGQJ_07800, partial [Xylella fastidiosa subsp. multiplex]